MEVSISALLFCEFLGTIAFSISGAMVAIKRKLDLFGVLTMGTVTAVGGGIIRDLFLGAIPPRAFTNFTSVLVAILFSLLVFVVSNIGEMYKHHNLIVSINNVFDAIGLGAFAVSGVQIAADAGYGEMTFLSIFCGVLTAIGGGILRDIMSMQIPFVFTRDIYATAAIAGSVLYYIFSITSISESIGTVLGILIVFSLRMIAIHFNWRLPTVKRIS